MLWAKRDGVRAHPSLARYFADLPTFSKSGQPHAGPRPIETFAPELMTRADPQPGEEAIRYSLFFNRPLRARLRDSWTEAGVPGVISCLWRSAKHRGKIVMQSVRGEQ